MQFYTASTKLPPFLPYPKFLLDLPLNETGRVVYSLILSRIHLSQSNNWMDDDQRVYCRYTIQDLMADTGKSKSTIITALADLEKLDLLFRRRGGAGYASKLYLKLPNIYTSEEQKTTPQKPEKLVPNNKHTNRMTKKSMPNYDYGGDSL